jgi:hypothetical protein
LQTSGNEAGLVDLWISCNKQVQGAGCKPAQTHGLPACCCQRLCKAASGSAKLPAAKLWHSKARARGGFKATRSRFCFCKPAEQQVDPALLKASQARTKDQGRQLQRSQGPLGGQQAGPSWSPPRKGGAQQKGTELSCSKGSSTGSSTGAHGSKAGLRALAQARSRAWLAPSGARGLRRLG